MSLTSSEWDVGRRAARSAGSRSRSIHGPTYGQRADLYGVDHPAKMRRLTMRKWGGATCVCWRCGKYRRCTCDNATKVYRGIANASDPREGTRSADHG